MSEKKVMNLSGAIDHDTGSKTSGGAFVITSTPSTKLLADGGGVYAGELTFSFSGGSSTETLSGTGAVTPGTVYGTGSISPTSEKVTSASLDLMRVDDSGSFITLFGTFTPTGGTPVPSTPLPVTDVVVTDAGQDFFYAS